METLFPLTETPLPPLEQARRDYEAAMADFERADTIEDETGEPIPDEVRRELRVCAARVRALEGEAMRRVWA